MDLGPIFIEEKKDGTIIYKDYRNYSFNMDLSIDLAELAKHSLYRFRMIVELMTEENKKNYGDILLAVTRDMEMFFSNLNIFFHEVLGSIKHLG